MLIQKFHPGINLHKKPVVSTASGLPLFSRQGHWDGGSTLHCVAMALALLGRLTDPVRLPFHKGSSEQRLWRAGWPHYLHGLTLTELASFISELNLGVRPTICTAPNAGLLDFAERELVAGRPVILGWSRSHPTEAHAALVVGIEGRQHTRRCIRDALLLIDPAGDAPALTAFNARLTPGAGNLLRYQSPDTTRSVTPEGAVSIRLTST